MQSSPRRHQQPGMDTSTTTAPIMTNQDPESPQAIPPTTIDSTWQPPLTLPSDTTSSDSDDDDQHNNPTRRTSKLMNQHHKDYGHRRQRIQDTTTHPAVLARLQSYKQNTGPWEDCSPHIIPTQTLDNKPSTCNLRRNKTIQDFMKRRPSPEKHSDNTETRITSPNITDQGNKRTGASTGASTGNLAQTETTHESEKQQHTQKPTSDMTLPTNISAPINIPKQPIPTSEPTHIQHHMQMLSIGQIPTRAWQRRTPNTKN
jgi:hypothetical protein